MTTCFANKTAARLAELSPHIVGVEAALEAVSDGIAAAIARIDEPATELRLPLSWSESFAKVVPRLDDELRRLLAPE